jgi:hypothetical protein
MAFCVVSTGVGGLSSPIDYVLEQLVGSDVDIFLIMGNSLL